MADAINLFYRTKDDTVERAGHVYSFAWMNDANSTAVYRCRRKVTIAGDKRQCPASIRVIQPINPKKPGQRSWECDANKFGFLFGKYDTDSATNDIKVHLHNPYSNVEKPLAESWVFEIKKMGTIIEPERIGFLPMKAPLDPYFDRLVTSQQDRFTPADICNHEELNGVLGLGMLINLTSFNTYKPENLQAHCEPKRVVPRSEHAPPSLEEVEEFISIVKEYKNKGGHNPIGVHCVQGFNRTGFMIVAYLTKVLGRDLDVALNMFAQARPPGIYNEEFVRELRALFPENFVNENVQLVRPSWEPSRPKLTNSRYKRSAQRTVFDPHMPVYTSQDHYNEVLTICNQHDDLKWAQFLQKRQFAKIGEGSFGEIFRDKQKDGNVIKVLPFLVEGDGPKVNGETMRRVEDVHAELCVTKALSELKCNPNQFVNESNWTPCFLKFKKSSVVKGKYPKNLLDAWDASSRKKKPLNERPSNYSSADRTFLVLEMENAGIDLEKFLQYEIDIDNHQSPQTLLSIFFQVALSLAVAEEVLEMEHRDLHEGNIMLQKVEDDDWIIKTKLKGVPYHLKAYNVQVTIIDFSLSRIRSGDRLFYLDLAKDDELFKGTKGDLQFDTYREMRNKMGNRTWDMFEPYSNILWLRYLAKKLLEKEALQLTPGHGPCMQELEYLKKCVTHYATIAEFLAEPGVKQILNFYLANQ